MGDCSLEIVANTLLQSKLEHRESVSGSSTRMRGKITSVIKSLTRERAKKTASSSWKMVLKHPK